jgi:hypothetical protein
MGRLPPFPACPGRAAGGFARAWSDAPGRGKVGSSALRLIAVKNPFKQPHCKKVP